VQPRAAYLQLFLISFLIPSLAYYSLALALLPCAAC